MQHQPRRIDDSIRQQLTYMAARVRRRTDLVKRAPEMTSHPLYEMLDMMDSRLMACESLLERIAESLEAQNRKGE